MIDRYSIELKFGEPVDEPKKGKNGGLEYRYNCPFCIDNRGDPDTKGHLFVNDKTGVYHCYRCGAKGRISRENSKGYSTSEELYCNKDIVERLESVLGGSESKDDFDLVIPRKKAYEDESAREYLHSRGFSDDLIDYYDFRVGGIFSGLLGYIVIPNEVKLKVKTDMYCARSFVGQKPKYRNPPEIKASHAVYNLHRICDNPDRIIICEGALTSIAAGKDAIALYGKECSETKLTKIIQKRPKSIVVNLDPDAESKAYELADRIKKRDSSIIVKIAIVNDSECKDAADYLSSGRIQEFREMIDLAPVYNPVLNKLNKILN